MIRIILAGICCGGILALDIEINKTLLNNTILVKGDINTYEECLKFYEKVSIRKQHKYYFKLLRLFPLLKKEEYETVKNELTNLTKIIGLNTTNQVLLEYYICLYHLRIGEKDKFTNEAQLFCSKWKDKNFSRKTNKLIDQCINSICIEKDGAKDISLKKSNGSVIRFKYIGFICIIIFTCFLGINLVNYIESRKYHRVKDAYDAQRKITEKGFNDLNIVYKKELDNYYLFITEDKTQFSYYIFEKSDLNGGIYYNLKNSYSDKKAVIDQYHLPLIVYEQMRMSKVNMGDGNNLFPVFGIVKEDDIEKVLVNNRKPDEYKEIVTDDKIYFVWYYNEITSESIESFILEQ